MRIGIVGAGHIGSALTHRLTALGHEVTVANSRGPETLADLVAETGARAVATRDAAEDAEVVVVTIPLRAVPELPDELLTTAADGVVVIDTNNYYPGRDGQIAEIDGGATSSRWVSEHLGHPVVKAFNSIEAAKLLKEGRPPGEPGRIALPVAGDDADAKAVVLRLVEELGFDPVDAGGVDDSWRQEPGTACYGADLSADALRVALAEERRDPG